MLIWIIKKKKKTSKIPNRNSEGTAADLYKYTRHISTLYLGQTPEMTGSGSL